MAEPIRSRALAPIGTIQPTPVQAFAPPEAHEGNPFALALQGFLAGSERQHRRNIQNQTLALQAQEQAFRHEYQRDAMAIQQQQFAEGLALDKQRQALDAQLGFANLDLDRTKTNIFAQQAALNMQTQALRLSQAHDVRTAQLTASKAINSRIDGVMSARRFGDMAIQDYYHKPKISTFSHLPDLSAKDKGDNGKSAWGGTTHDKAGVAMPHAYIEALGLDPKTSKVVVRTKTGEVRALPIIDKGTAEWVVEREGNFVLDLTPKALRELGSDVIVEGDSITGVVDPDFITDMKIVPDGEAFQQSLAEGQALGDVSGPFGSAFSTEEILWAPTRRFSSTSTEEALRQLHDLDLIAEESPQMGPAEAARIQSTKDQILADTPGAAGFYKANQQAKELGAIFADPYLFAEFSQIYAGVQDRLSKGDYMDNRTWAQLQQTVRNLDTNRLRSDAIARTQSGSLAKLSTVALDKLNADYDLVTKAETILSGLGQFAAKDYNPLVNRLRDVFEKFGIQAWDPNDSAFLGAYQYFQARFLANISGAAVTVQEFERIAKAIGNPGGMTAATFKTRTEDFLSGFVDNYKRRVASYQTAGYAVPPELGGGTQPNSASSQASRAVSLGDAPTYTPFIADDGKEYIKDQTGQVYTPYYEPVELQ